MKKGLVVLTAVFLLFAALIPGLKASAAGKAEFLLKSETVNVKVGDEYTVYVYAKGVTDIYGFEALVAYDTTLAELVTAKSGEVPTDGFGYLKTENEEKGTVRGIYTCIGKMAPLSADGNIYKFVFKALAEGSAKFSIKTAKAVDSNVTDVALTLTNSPILTVEQKKAAVTVSFTTQPQNKSVTQGSITAKLSAAAKVSVSGKEATLKWYQCDKDGKVSGKALSTGKEFTIPTTLTQGTYYYVCQAEYTGAKTVSSNVAVITVKSLDDQRENCIKFVTRMYQNTLSREPEEAGLNYWVNSMMKGAESGATLALGFVFSEEFISKNLSDGDYVKTLYRAFFGREAEEDGYKFWVGLLEKGTSRQFILSGFIVADEYKAMCASCGISEGTFVSAEARDQNPDLTAYVVRCYTKALGRTYDVGGLNFWTESIITGKTGAKEAALFFIHSPEFVEKGLSDEEYVKVLYRTFFGREYDDEGFAFWMDTLKTGKGDRESVLQFFADSPEFKTIMTSYGVQ